MPTNYLLGLGLQTNEALPTVEPTDVERDAWAHFDALADAKRAIWLDATTIGEFRPYLAMGVADDPALSQLVDRCGDRIFTPERYLNRHPIVVTDSITGRDVLCFGAGGTSPNALSDANNGVMECVSILDSSGAEANNVDIIVPGAGFSCAAKVRIPVPSTTVNGIPFGTATGGSVFGSHVTADDTSSLFAGILSSNGQPTVRTRDTGGSTAATAVDLRDSAWHDIVISYERSTTTLKIWTDGVLGTPVTDATLDVASVAGAAKILLGARGRSVGGPSSRFIGFLAFAAFTYGPVFANDAARAAVRNLMATK